jgi:putative ABC transport system permease protein
MFKNYFKTAWRNLWKNRFYASINIAGLAVGLAGFIVILLYLNYELSYDTWDPSLKRVFKIAEQRDDDILQQTPMPLADFLKQQLPQVEASTSVQPAGDFEFLISAGDKKIFQKDGVDADSNFLKVFPFKIIGANSSTVLNKPNAIIISTELAKKLFGKEKNVIGKTIKLFNDPDYEITGLFEMPDKPSHFDVQFVCRDRYEKANFKWSNYMCQTYIKTKQPITILQLEDAANRVYYNERLKKGNQSLSEFRKAGHTSGLFAAAVNVSHNVPKYGYSQC